MRHYRFIDYATQGYLALVGLLILLLHGDAVPSWPILLSVHLVAMGLVHTLIWLHATRTPNRLMDFLRHFYPILLYTGFYRETEMLNHMLVAGFLDPVFIRLEQRIFGLQPSLALMEWLPYLVVSELMYLSYFSYYVMIAGVGMALFVRHRGQFFHYVSVVSFVFYCCYLTYILLPVMGPRILFREISGFTLPAELPSAVVPVEDYPKVVTLGPCYHLMGFIYEHFEALGAAFPSSHVAIAIVTLYFSRRYLPRIRALHLVMVVLLCLSTVYCRYHYAVDVAAGALTAALLIPLGNVLYFSFQARETENLPPRSCCTNRPPARRE